MGRANALFSSPAPLVWEDPSHLPLLISPASLLCPQGPPWPGVGSGGQGTSLGAQQAPQAQVGGAIALHSSPAPPGGLLLPASPVLPSASFLCPQGPTRPGGGFGGQGMGLGAQQASWAQMLIVNMQMTSESEYFKIIY